VKARVRFTSLSPNSGLGVGIASISLRIICFAPIWKTLQFALATFVAPVRLLSVYSILPNCWLVNRYLFSSIVVVTTLWVVSTALPNTVFVTAGYRTASVTITPRKNLPIFCSCFVSVCVYYILKLPQCQPFFLLVLT
jgi:hypothetical protein